LIDAGGGEKLEIWGNVKVVRPDPQAFWPKAYEWEKPDLYYRRSKSGGGKWEVYNKDLPSKWTISYKNLVFNIEPTGFKHMGLFPEQAVNWAWLKSRIRSGDKILNLFAYTGGATVNCLAAGAEVTHVDAAKSMNARARENIASSGLSAKARVLTDDVLKFAAREARRGNTYDGIIMDPPVFGRGPGGEMWQLEERLFELVSSCSRILSHSANFMLINAYTSGHSPTAFGNILEKVTAKVGGIVSVGEVGISAESGVTLPCGMYARWER